MNCRAFTITSGTETSTIYSTMRSVSHSRGKTMVSSTICSLARSSTDSCDTNCARSRSALWCDSALALAVCTGQIARVPPETAQQLQPRSCALAKKTLTTESCVSNDATCKMCKPYCSSPSPATGLSLRTQWTLAGTLQPPRTGGYDHSLSRFIIKRVRDPYTLGYDALPATDVHVSVIYWAPTH